MGHSIKSLLGVILSGILVLLLIFTMALPWYFTKTSVAGCSVTELFGWKTAYCTVNSGSCSCPSKTMSWRSSGTSHLNSIYDATLAMLLLCFFCTVASCALFVLKLMGKFQMPMMKLIHLSINIAGIVLLLLAIIIFGGGVPNAFKKDTDCLGGTSPCKNFFGSSDGTSWGGAGWLVAILFDLPLYAVVAFLGYREYSTPLV